jgi:FkbM family methyltransferase
LRQERSRILNNIMEKLISLVKMFIPPILWTYFKRLPINLRKYYGVDNLDQQLERYLDFQNGFFVELGANDGLNQSNTFYFEKFKGWKGVLVEPSPHNYLKLLTNRSSDNFMFCNACVSFDYKEEFVGMVYSNLMSTSLNVESDIPDPLLHAEIGLNFLEKTERVFTFGALATTLTDILLNSHAPQKIDLLSLDVEGAEMEVLKGIDHSRYRFKYMCIEVRNFEKMNDYLSENGYVFVEKLSKHDYLFKDAIWI